MDRILDFLIEARFEAFLPRGVGGVFEMMIEPRCG
jgi:hypothetical protein